MNRSRNAVAVLALAMMISLPARAQTPGLPPPGGGAPEDEPKPEGVAEKAPREAGELPTMPTLPPWPGQKRKKFELLELDGYFRMRSDWFSNFNLGFHSTGVDGQGTPFPQSLSCLDGAPPGSDCTDSIGSANMRLRLEPVINLSEQISVHIQVDILDNLVLGATPDGVLFNGTPPPPNIPINAFSGSQVPVEAGRNYITDSILVKQAWGEVKVPDVGVLRFGRMPSHWGLGVLANSGGADPFRGTYCLDCDYGDNVDRVLFGTMIPGTQFRVAIAHDWASSEPVASQVAEWANRFGGQPWDLDDVDDVSQWVFVLARLDGPEEWKDTVDQGELALNYGVYFVYRSQDFETQGTDFTTITPQDLIERRDASAYIPDVYFRLGYKKLLIEAEAVLIMGSIGEVTETIKDQDILQFGAVARLNYLMLDDDLNLGMEVGTATGDQWDPTLQGLTNFQDTPILPEDPEDHTISRFFFDPNYHVDLILFRELLGTVSNATYFKPSVAYNLTNRIVFRAAGIVSFANIPVATPGNGTMYGIELDGDLGYENKEEGFFAGLSYGVYFPMGAMAHPSDLRGTGGVQIYSVEEQGDPETAQTVQARLVLKF